MSKLSNTGHGGRDGFFQLQSMNWWLIVKVPQRTFPTTTKPIIQN